MDALSLFRCCGIFVRSSVRRTPFVTYWLVIDTWWHHVANMLTLTRHDLVHLTPNHVFFLAFQCHVFIGQGFYIVRVPWIFSFRLYLDSLEIFFWVIFLPLTSSVSPLLDVASWGSERNKLKEAKNTFYKAQHFHSGSKSAFYLRAKTHRSCYLIRPSVLKSFNDLNVC